MASENGFERMRQGYVNILHFLLRRKIVVPIIAVLITDSLGGHHVHVRRPRLFPLIDGGQIQLHVRGPAGMRIESTEALFQKVEDKIREVIPEKDRELIVDNIGLPARVTISPSAMDPPSASTTA